MKFGRRKIKNALKALDLEQSEENIMKLSLTFGEIPSIDESVSDKEEKSSTKYEIFGVVSENNKTHHVVKVGFNLTEAEILATFDNEARAVLERRQREVLSKMEEYKKEIR